MENNINNGIVTGYNLPSNQNNKPKINIKIIAAIATAVIVIILGLLIYFFTRDNRLTPNTTNPIITLPGVGTTTGDGTEYYGDNNGSDDNPYVESEYNELIHIWPRAVSGYEVIKVLSASSTLISRAIFMDSLTGNIYKSDYPAYIAEKITSDTISNTIRSAFSYDGKAVSVLYSDFILRTASIPEVPGLLTNKEEVSDAVIDFAFSKNDNRLAYLKKEGVGSSLYIYNLDTKAKNKIYDSPLTDLSIEWLNVNNIIVKSKPASITTQGIINVDVRTGKASILNNQNISNKLLPDYKNISYNGSNIEYSTQINDINKVNTTMRSLPEKCIYSDSRLACGVSDIGFASALPDDWYKGKVSFVDSLRIYNTIKNSYSKYELSLVAGQNIDLYKPDNYADTLIFMNKRDMSLWLLDLGYIFND